MQHERFQEPRVVETARLFVCICALAFWQGGLTFYAVVVVPVANSILVGGEQGFVTQQVTNWMNRVGVLVMCILVVQGAQMRSRVFWWMCAFLGATLAGLFVIHARVDALLDPASFSVVDRERFGLWHEAYLTVITIQWCAALMAAWLLLRRRPKSSSVG